MRTTKKEFKMMVQSHVLGNLSEDFGETLTEQLQATVDGFYNWYGAYEQKRTPNKYEAFKEWLKGLPSEMNVEYTWHGVHSALKFWFETCGEVYKEQDSDKEAELYYHLVTREFSVLCKAGSIHF